MTQDSRFTLNLRMSRPGGHRDATALQPQISPPDESQVAAGGGRRAQGPGPGWLRRSIMIATVPRQDSHGGPAGDSLGRRPAGGRRPQPRLPGPPAGQRRRRHSLATPLLLVRSLSQCPCGRTLRPGPEPSSRHGQCQDSESDSEPGSVPVTAEGGQRHRRSLSGLPGPA